MPRSRTATASSTHWASPTRHELPIGPGLSAAGRKEEAVHQRIAANESLRSILMGLEDEV